MHYLISTLSLDHTGGHVKMLNELQKNISHGYRNDLRIAQSCGRKHVIMSITTDMIYIYSWYIEPIPIQHVVN